MFFSFPLVKLTHSFVGQQQQQHLKSVLIVVNGQESTTTTATTNSISKGSCPSNLVSFVTVVVFCGQSSVLTERMIAKMH